MKTLIRLISIPCKIVLLFPIGVICVLLILGGWEDEAEKIMNVLAEPWA